MVRLTAGGRHLKGKSERGARRITTIEETKAKGKKIHDNEKCILNDPRMLIIQVTCNG
jgi:hypothetical protein